MPESAELSAYHSNFVVSGFAEGLQFSFIEGLILSHLFEEEDEGEGQKRGGEALQSKIEDGCLK